GNRTMSRASRLAAIRAEAQRRSDALKRGDAQAVNESSRRLEQLRAESDRADLGEARQRGDEAAIRRIERRQPLADPFAPPQKADLAPPPKVDLRPPPTPAQTRAVPQAAPTEAPKAPPAPPAPTPAPPLPVTLPDVQRLAQERSAAQQQ